MSLAHLTLVAGCFFLLYIPFLSIDYDPNGVIEAMNLESGVRLSPNHILYTALGRVFYQFAQTAGYTGKSLHILQVFNAICGAVAVALAFAAMSALGIPRRAALAAAMLWGTSFVFWYFSTDVSYVTLAAALTAGALWCSAELSRKRSAGIAVVLGLLSALAILTFQMACFLLPVLLWPLRRRLREALLSVTSAAVLLGTSYVVIGVSQGITSPTDFIQWVGHYAGGQLPEWGQFESRRILIAAEAAVRSFQWDVFERGKDFLEHPFQRYVWRITFGAVSFTLFMGATALLGLWQAARRNSDFFWMLVGYVVCWPFIIWFSPSESFWFLVPNLFLCAAIAIAWARLMRSPMVSLFVFGSVLMMAGAIFMSWVWPKHVDPGVVGRKVDCIAMHMQSADAVIATDWTWPAKLEYFHGIRSLQIIDLSSQFQRDRDKLFAFVASELDKTLQARGRVFIIDPASYPPDHLSWLEEQTGFLPSDFDRYPGTPAFQCEDSTFREVVVAP